ncbi:uncharacterized protein N7515_000767 [Penicillium bovifimosum]|uniref:Apple domain-containing protein n=1 Tax=Penicillium bovifimosum TaxID=126998 RepID=A0A9W9HGE1_9EURO|nr:uncharacterized protein N7515_000767 [Penicillium bovifimosum]KAJ5146203.1 hypothetical protein N7515_000767 [Penicillium bovifimosum]
MPECYVFSALANNQDEIGTCKLYNKGSFQTARCGDDTHDYAYITAPPAIESADRAAVVCATECPGSDGQQYESKGGELFHIDCAKRHGTQVILEDTQETFKDCIDACSRFIPCHSVDYHTSSKTCYYSNHHGEPEIVASGFQSAHSQGCSGACKNQHMGTCCDDQVNSGQEAGIA